MNFSSLTREAIEDELRRCNRLLCEDGRRISSLATALRALCDQCLAYANDENASLPDPTDALATLEDVAGLPEATPAVGRLTPPAFDELNAAAVDLLDQLEGVGLYIPGNDSGHWAGSEGLSFNRIEQAISAVSRSGAFRRENSSRT